MKLFFYSCTNQTLADCPWFIYFSRIEGWRFFKKTFFSLCFQLLHRERECSESGRDKVPPSSQWDLSWVGDKPLLWQIYEISALTQKVFLTWTVFTYPCSDEEKRMEALTRQHQIGNLSPLMSACEVTCGLLWSQPHCRVLASGLRQRLIRWLITLKHVVSHFHCIQRCCFDPLSQLSCFCLKERHSVNQKKKALQLSRKTKQKHLSVCLQPPRFFYWASCSGGIMKH